MTLLTQGLLIGFFGSGLYFAVDEYEPDRAVAFMLKLLLSCGAPPSCFTKLVCLATGFSDTAVTHRGLRDAHFADQTSRKYAMIMAGGAVSCVRTTTKSGITCGR
jgi:hypothetical protein